LRRFSSSAAEVEALARAAEDDQDAALFRVAAFTGLRLGELRALRWQDVDFGKRLVHVRRNFTERTPKSGRVRSAPLIDQAAKALDGLSRRDRFTDPADLVFVDDVGGHLDDWRLRNRFHDALDRAGLPRLRLHDLRHTFGILAVQAVPLTDVKAYMGHADISTTMIYVHHVPPRQRRRPALPAGRRGRVGAASQAGFGTHSGHGSRAGRHSRRGNRHRYGASGVGPPGFEPGTNGL
jgi:integrase